MHLARLTVTCSVHTSTPRLPATTRLTALTGPRPDHTHVAGGAAAASFCPRGRVWPRHTRDAAAGPHVYLQRRARRPRVKPRGDPNTRSFLSAPCPARLLSPPLFPNPLRRALSSSRRWATTHRHRREPHRPAAAPSPQGTWPPSRGNPSRASPRLSTRPPWRRPRPRPLARRLPPFHPPRRLLP
jgi:hypothetical protein